MFPLEAEHEMHIYDLPDIPEINAYTHVLHWIEYYEKVHLGRVLADDEYIFPSMSPAGVINPNTPISPKAIQDWIDEAVAGAGIPEIPGYRFTTHCFRRGGAQHAQDLGWSLDCIQWWGNWADGEHVSLSLFVGCLSNC